MITNHGRLRGTTRTAATMAAMLAFAACAVTVSIPTSHADNKRLNNSVFAGAAIVRGQAGCAPSAINKSPQLQLAAQWHALDVLHNRSLSGDLGSDGSMPQDRATAAGFRGTVQETVAINPALAISGIELIRKWYYDPAASTIMRNCANTVMGVWSENSLDRTVVVAVYGVPQ